MQVYEDYPKIPLEDFIADLRYDIPGVPQAAWKSYIRRAATRMALDGNLLRRKMTIRVMDCGVRNYRLEPGDCTDLVAILNVRNICGLCQSEVPRVTQAPPGLSCSCSPVSWFEEPNELWFSQVQAGQIYEVEFSVAPTMDACELDACFRKGDHYELLLLGARSMAYDVADQYWYDAQKAQMLEAKFEHGVRGLAITSYMGRQRGVMQPKRRRLL